MSVRHKALTCSCLHCAWRISESTSLSITVFHYTLGKHTICLCFQAVQSIRPRHQAMFNHMRTSRSLICSKQTLPSFCAGVQYAQGRHVVIKSHCWSDKWDLKQANFIFLTHRDLQGVVASYRRVGWAFDIPDSYVREHQQWRVQPFLQKQFTMMYSNCCGHNACHAPT